MFRHLINILATHHYSPSTHPNCHIPTRNTATNTTPEQTQSKPQWPRKHLRPHRNGLVAPQNSLKVPRQPAQSFFSKQTPPMNSSSISSVKWMSSRRSANTETQAPLWIHWSRPTEAQSRRAERASRSEKQGGAPVLDDRVWKSSVRHLTRRKVLNLWDD